jgi:cytochrome P450 family 89 subfamily A
MDDDFVAALAPPPHLSGVVTVLLLLLTAASLLVIRRHNTGDDAAGSLGRELSAPVMATARRRGRSTRRGLSIHVTDRAVARRALVQHSAAFLDRPATSVPSTILARSRHHNVLPAPYGATWPPARCTRPASASSATSCGR